MVAPWKTKEVETLAKKMGESKVVGLVRVNNIPSKQAQQIRRNLRGEMEIKVSKSNIIKRALDKAGIEGLSEYVDGPTGVVFTELNPFKLEKKIFDNRTNAPAKAGSEATKDITIPKGDTPFAPGPIIGDLQKVGIKAKIQGGKIIVTADSPVVKEGEVISRDLANVLSRMGITPVTIGLNLVAVFDGEMVYEGSTLHIDEAETIGSIQSAYNSAFNLAFNAGVINNATIKHFIAKAAADARNLAINAEVINADTVGFFLNKASAQANALKTILPPEVLEVVEAKEEKPAKNEGKKEDQPAESKEKKDEAEKPSEESKEKQPAESKGEEEKTEAPSEEVEADATTPKSK